ncbi:MAG: PHP domain-containing protein [Bacillota bacterium]
MAVDLHVHTSASDGTDDPGLVVCRAAEIGLEAVGITDHDTVDGLAPALQAGRAQHLEVIPGIELSTEEKGTEFHLLGYLIDFQSADFLEYLSRLRANRAERAYKMVQKLRELGFPITYDQVLAVAGRAAVGRPHIARVLVQEGLVGTMKEAFDQYIGAGCPAYIPRFKYSPREAVQLIIRARGIPVLAHPGLAGRDGIIPELVRAGLRGLEVYYPLHTGGQIEHYLHLCTQHGLIPTGGSDYHGAGHEEHGQLAAVTVPYTAVQRLKETAVRLYGGLPAYIKNE